MKKIFKARKGAWFGDDRAQKYGQRIEVLSKESSITPHIVVEDAKKKSSPLHDAFEWDNNEAAQKYRLYQARLLLKHIEVEIVVEDRKEPIRQPVYLSLQGGEDDRRYYHYSRVLSEDDLKEEALRNALDEAERWRNKYYRLRELSEIINAIDETKKKLK